MEQDGKRKPELREIVIVEGRNDTAAVKRAIASETIETHGFGIRAETWARIERAWREKGIIVFTDPDHAGEEIRRRITLRYPGAKQAYLAREDAAKNGNVGIENAEPPAILSALEKARASLEESRDVFQTDILKQYGLLGEEGAAEKRAAVGKTLGIGYGNAKAFLTKLNKYRVTPEELHEAVLAEDHRGDRRKV